MEGTVLLWSVSRFPYLKVDEKSVYRAETSVKDGHFHTFEETLKSVKHNKIPYLIAPKEFFIT